MNGAGGAAVDQVGTVLDPFESMLHGSGDLGQVGCGEIAQVAFDHRPHAFLRVQVRCVGRQLEHGEPVGIRLDELP